MKFKSPSVFLRAPAKINLSLKIVGRREDGYHLIESLFAPISLFDEITIAPVALAGADAGAGAIKDICTYKLGSENGLVLNFQDDTVLKALKVLRAKVAPFSLSYQKVTVIKRIPFGAGLGGGSSDAASVLTHMSHALSTTEALTQISPPTFSQKLSPARSKEIITESDLREVASAVGSDVPFFLQNGPAYVSGVGENVVTCKLDKLFIALVKPDFSVETKRAYQWFDAETKLTRSSINVTFPVISGAKFFGIKDIVRDLDNDLEKPVEARHPEITRLKKVLVDLGALGSQMSGSGSSVFGLFETAEKTERAIIELKKIFPSSYLFFSCHTL